MAAAVAGGGQEAGMKTSRIIVNSEETRQQELTECDTMFGMDTEIWKAVPGYEGVLEASDLGRIRAVSRMVNTCYGSQRRTRTRLIAQKGGKRGYLRVCPNYGGTTFVHRLVAMTFVPNPLGLPVINHKDGDKANNRPENLEWCTQRENNQHAHRTGLARGMKLLKGDQSIAAKLTGAQVSEIKRRLGAGEKASALAREFGVVSGTIGEIKAGRSWGHIK